MGNCIFCNPNVVARVWESENFFISYDRYPIVPGHIMLISKLHFGCAGEIYSKMFTELNYIKDLIVNYMLKIGYKIILYEHGRAGVCVKNSDDQDDIECSHFHLHILPLLLTDFLLPEVPKIQMSKYSEIKSLFASYGKYLFIENFNVKKMHFLPVGNITIPPHYIRTLLINHIHLSKTDHFYEKKDPEMNFCKIFNSKKLLKNDLYG